LLQLIQALYRGGVTDRSWNENLQVLLGRVIRGLTPSGYANRKRRKLGNTQETYGQLPLIASRLM